MMESRSAAAAYRSSDHRTDRDLWRKALAEAGAFTRLVSAQFRAPPIAREQIDGAPVMVLPGLMMSDFHTQLLRRTLRACGINAIGWGQGTNRGIERADLDRLERRICRHAAETGRKIVLIGWSLGGFYACDLAERRPDAVSMVVTLGTPFSHRAPRGRGADPVYTVACWSSQDQIVPARSAAGRDGEVHDRVRLNCSHTELVSDPDALRAIVALLREHPVVDLPSS